MLLDVERGVPGVRERADRGVPAGDDRTHRGVAWIEAGAARRCEGAADAGADGDHGAVGGADDVGEREAGLGCLHDVLGPELEAGERERRVGRWVGDRGVPGEGGRDVRAGAGEVEGRGAAHALLLDVERGVLGVGVRTGDRVTGHQGDTGEAGGEGGRALRADEVGQRPARDRQGLDDRLGTGRVGAGEGERAAGRKRGVGVVVEAEAGPEGAAAGAGRGVGKVLGGIGHGVLGHRDRGIRGVGVRAGRGVPGRDDRAHRGVARGRSPPWRPG